MKKLLNIRYILLIFIALIFLTVGLWLYKMHKYSEIEKDYIAAATFIYEENGIENAANISQIILTRREINLMLAKPALDDTCNGYVIIKPSDQGPEYKAYITCNGIYTSKDFNRKNLE
jgi:hypothetical protein